jgi:HAE1 family hydrophobic/amphiphilic exporter-1
MVWPRWRIRLAEICGAGPLNPDALASRGIGIDAVENAIRQANVNLPVGTLDGAHQSFTLHASGQLTTAEPYRSIIVAYRNGSPVRLGDLGRVLDSVEDEKTAAWYGDTNAYERSIVLAIKGNRCANTVAVANSVKQLIPYFQRLLPPRRNFTFCSIARIPFTVP